MEKFWGDKGGVGKVACWSTKVAISLKRVKIEEKLLWRAYRKSPMLFRFFGLLLVLPLRTAIETAVFA